MPLKAAALAHAIADLVAEAEGIEAPLGVLGRDRREGAAK